MLNTNLIKSEKFMWVEEITKFSNVLVYALLWTFTFYCKRKKEIF